ncbi:type IV secretory system conjugative DNA transfer family protein [Nostoc sp. FACHB-87]|uniref:type IV secretory system conjugative DNA transfer family protein n=1 Tax=Nostocales TaxID=1161 RepID=UPI0016867B93|nr:MULTISPECIES: TraM recognition domain-containing protein [Nostocales]MBD2303270.1 type IV secretory system conjugative DNA transfer family protein [Nostoc sp. FACHB-190]MBD2458308.1 type IV secretory system conjugative DNA transfer family protein [Nostoc sp. FACHB-87]MBD2479456.1 type IV secretory system conjugative DNA transfer family protein [Anabaena sp. FACHB-83]MBD2491249.1 type IV secretory system conjugative DNA transfer family protein [Aulosira sp. FACHB-615]
MSKNLPSTSTAKNQQFRFEQLTNPNDDIGKYTYQLFTPNGLTVLSMLAAYILIRVLFGDSSNKKKIATSYWGGSKEIATAKKKALKQIANPKCDSAALYVGDYFNKKGSSNNTTFFIPDVQRGTAAIGAPGTGKTAGAINPMIYSAIEQGFSIVAYDFKYPSQAKIAAYAKSQGYDVHIFAPGFPESEVCNPIDFLRDSSDAETARQIATVINKNFRILNNSNEDGFFGPSGDQLTQAILMLTKEFGEQADVMTSAAILSSEQMVQRLMGGDLNPWVKIAFGQLFSSAASEKTVAGIVATASIMFTRFMAKNTVGCFIGKTTLPLELSGKQMIIFGLDRERREAVGPLMTSILHMIIARNIAKRRKEPLIVALDELPSIYLPDLFRWLNESRSEGFCGLLGWQNMAQLEKNYGKEVARAILGACSTKFIFNPGENDSAQLFSSFLGDEEIKYKHKSRSTGGGKANTTTSDQEKTKKLFEPAQFLKLPLGKCVFINPAYANKKEGSVPLLKNIKLSRHLKNIEAYNEEHWSKLVSYLVRKSQQRFPTKEDVESRRAEINVRFPLPQTPQNAQNPSPFSISEVSSLINSESSDSNPTDADVFI